MRVRDEVRMTISAYQTLYQSSITFGMRKTLQAEQGNSELIKRVSTLQQHNTATATQLNDNSTKRSAADYAQFEATRLFDTALTFLFHGCASLWSVVQIGDLEVDKRKFQSLVQDHKGLYESIEKRIAEQKAQEEKKMQEEKDFLKFQAQHLESFLKSAAQ